MSEKPLNNPWDSPVFSFDRIDSTNTELLRAGRAGASEGTVAIARCQSAGRGRRGRSWYSPAGGLWMSVLLCPPETIDLPGGLSLLVGVAIARALEFSLQIKPGLNWPNDILVQDRKVGGILLETSSGPAGRFVVAGIGLNLAVEQFPSELDNTAASLVGGGSLPENRRKLADEVLLQLYRVYGRFIAAGTAAWCMQEYRERSVTLGQSVKVHHPDGVFRGRAVDIAATGELLVEGEDGTLRRVCAGEVSIRSL